MKDEKGEGKDAYWIREEKKTRVRRKNRESKTRKEVRKTKKRLFISCKKKPYYEGMEGVKQR